MAEEESTKNQLEKPEEESTSKAVLGKIQILVLGNRSTGKTCFINGMTERGNYYGLPMFPNNWYYTEYYHCEFVAF
jgi:septin family protein